jgi:hypothetical protein
MKLNSSIPSNGVKLIDLYNKIISGSLETGPEFQRKKLVWKKQHKFSFIETILLNFPFPEIYIASSHLDLNELKAKEIVVDGQQRLTTIIDYIQARNDFISQKSITPFDELGEQEKRDFLNYLITVKDLKDLTQANIIEVFKRINSTNYSLNTNEVLNAEYGGGEFAIFCKTLADKNYELRANETSIEIDKEQRELINTFLEKNNVFSNNDIKRMFDSQFIMLLSSTILEGQYFSRSSKINDYLERYNNDFKVYKEILNNLIGAFNLIDKLGFSEKSYWFNKANLFTLIIELVKFSKEELNLNSFEIKLNELENKSDLYFVGEEDNLALISPDEMKYFEVARQGSHELSAREHRGKVIGEILEACKTTLNPEENITKKLLEEKQINFSVLIPTATGLSKSIMDATQKIRQFLKTENIHNYIGQDFGPNHKVKLKANYILEDLNEKETEVSLYRANGRGDYRIWFSELKDYSDESNELVLINIEGLKILNTTKFDYSEYINKVF